MVILYKIALLEFSMYCIFNTAHLDNEIYFRKLTYDFKIIKKMKIISPEILIFGWHRSPIEVVKSVSESGSE